MVGTLVGIRNSGAAAQSDEHKYLDNHRCLRLGFKTIACPRCLATSEEFMFWKKKRDVSRPSGCKSFRLRGFWAHETSLKRYVDWLHHAKESPSGELIDCEWQ